MKRPAKGFTLLEVLIALTIFTIIGVATVKHLQQLMNTKNYAFAELDLYNNLRAAISLMRFDLSQAFHIQYDELGAEAKQAVLQNQPVPHTMFDGRKNELIFTSLSHRVYYAGLRECEQTEISYFLQPRDRQLPVFMKRESEIIDSDLYQGGAVYTLVENVTSLTFQYWDEKTAKWVDDWSSDNGEYRDRFPLAVRATLTVASAGKKDLKLSSEFKVAFPNNEQVLVQFQ